MYYYKIFATKRPSIDRDRFKRVQYYLCEENQKSELHRTWWCGILLVIVHVYSSSLH
jgi:hypothetical protein